MLIAVLLPLYPLLYEGEPLPHRDLVAAQSDLEIVQALSQEALQKNERVLFIGQRHLLTFHLIKPVPFEPNYELLELMEMAMSDNRDYLEQFYQDLRKHTFGLIITDPQPAEYKDPTFSFPEENNVWLEKVTTPLLEYYQLFDHLTASGVQIYVPRE